MTGAELLMMLVAGTAGGLAASVGVIVGMLLEVKPYVRKRITAERASFAARDAATWRNVAPLGGTPGSLAHIAFVIGQELPLGLAYTMRARDTDALPLGTVRVSIECGRKEET